MADFFIRRPIVAMVIAIVTAIVGLVSLSGLPIAEYPPVSPTLIQVTANYRGAAAEAVMDSVATPIESQVNGVDRMLYLQSINANDGKMTLNVTFDILMTSFAFILGCVPLMLASGSGAAARTTMGTGVVFGMTVATLLGVFLIPVCYAFVESLVARSGGRSAAESPPAPATIGPSPEEGGRP